MKKMFSSVLNRFAWKVFKATSSTNDLHFVVLRHSCGSEEVQPMGRMFHWKEPAFQCFRCNAIIPDGGITLRSVNAGEVHNRKSFVHALF